MTLDGLKAISVLSKEGSRTNCTLVILAPAAATAAAAAVQAIVKVPMTLDGLKAISVLSKEGIRTNCTLVFSANQALMAARAGAYLVSPFVGRLDDIGHDGMQVGAGWCWVVLGGAGIEASGIWLLWRLGCKGEDGGLAAWVGVGGGGGWSAGAGGIGGGVGGWGGGGACVCWGGGGAGGGQGPGGGWGGGGRGGEGGRGPRGGGGGAKVDFNESTVSPMRMHTGVHLPTTKRRCCCGFLLCLCFCGCS